MQENGRNIFTRRPPPPIENSTFSEHGHVTYQFKRDRKCSNMQAHILSLHTPSTPGMWSKVKTFFSESSHVAYQIKGNGA